MSASARLRRVEQRPPVDRQLDGVQSGLVAVEHHQRLGLDSVQLPAQLRADRSAGAGDEDPAPTDVPGDRRGVDVGGVPAEQVLDRDRPDVGRCAPSRTVRRPAAARAPRVRASSNGSVISRSCSPARRGDGDEHASRRRGRPPPSSSSALSSLDAQTVDAQPGLVRVVVEQGDGAVRAVGCPQHRLERSAGRRCRRRTRRPDGCRWAVAGGRGPRRGGRGSARGRRARAPGRRR